MNNTQNLVEAVNQLLFNRGEPEAWAKVREAAARCEREQARTARGYTGHNAVGGLQAHSTGDRFPWTIIAQGIEPQYRAFNCNTEQRGPLRDSAAAAGRDVDFALSLERGEPVGEAPSWLVAFLKVHQPRTVNSYEGVHS